MRWWNINIADLITLYVVYTAKLYATDEVIVVASELLLLVLCQPA